MNRTFLPANRISTQCADDSRHYACGQHRAAWDVVFDHQVDCACWCHRASQRISTACQDELRHLECAHDAAAWDVVLDRSAECACECHQRCQ